uniref:NADH dehydrogenase subunit 6 n=1 Tax=Pujadella villari TaxID=2943468 RepID=A0A9E8GDB3_9HYME|nr:NADH dehydrogenase subunit 6 [Pujadella villari]
MYFMMMMNLISYFYLFVLIFMFMLILIPSNFRVHPLIFGMVLLLYAILVSLLLNFFNQSSLYSYLMFLIVVGGFLVLFLYFNSFAINNKMHIDMSLIKMYIYKIFMMFLMLGLMVYKFNFFNMLLFLGSNLLEMNMMNLFYYKMNNLNISNLYNNMDYLVIFGMIYLFYTLVIVVKVIYYTNSKAIRQML